jgi:phosphatidylinositol kinase/protein kinase (PI-3  family)
MRGADAHRRTAVEPDKGNKQKTTTGKNTGVPKQPQQTSIHGRKRLRDFSPVLCDFRLSSSASDLVVGLVPVPCYATGDDHAGPHIAGFGGDIAVMSSIRAPVRLTVRGSDEKDYAVLVKGGEDLRLDERLQQLFALANEILAGSAACSRRSLRIHTYAVAAHRAHRGA